MMEAETRAAIDAYVASGKVRRFEPGCTVNNEILFAYMREKGFNCRCTGWGHMLKVIASKGRGRPKHYSFRDFIRLVDEYRIVDGLEPIEAKHGRAA